MKLEVNIVIKKIKYRNIGQPPKKKQIQYSYLDPSSTGISKILQVIYNFIVVFSYAHITGKIEKQYRKVTHVTILLRKKTVHGQNLICRPKIGPYGFRPKSGVVRYNILYFERYKTTFFFF